MAKAKTVKKMSLSDFFFADKHAAGSRMPIMLPGGEDSGEWLNVLGPDCDAAITAAREYTAAYRMAQESLAALDAECKEKDNWAEYNDRLTRDMEPHNRIYAAKIVTGWSFDNEFTPEALAELLHQFRGLAEAVAKFHTESRDAYLVK